MAIYAQSKTTPRPLSLYLCEVVSAERNGQRAKAQRALDIFLSLHPAILTHEQMRILALSHSLFGSRNSEHFGWRNLQDKVLANTPLHVLFINDVGFNAGAGFAMARQAQSFLKHGHSVSLICARDDPNLGRLAQDRFSGTLRESLSIRKLILDDKTPRTRKACKVAELAQSIEPDVVITGNFHASAMPSGIIRHIHQAAIPVFVYAHDCDWISGGCAHPLYHACEKYLSGCFDDDCPKDKMTYPPLLGATVSGNWSERQQLFKILRVPLVTNSHWNTRQHRRRFGPGSNIKTVHLGINTELFKRRNKAECKRSLGINPKDHLIVAGSGFFRARGKGGSVLQDLFDHYSNRKDVSVGYFGGAAEGDLPSNVHSFGYVRDESVMADIFCAADVFVNPVTIEAFGQTMLESAACGCPIVSYSACGVTDISVDGLTALHADPRDPQDLIRKIDTVLSDQALRKRLGANAEVIARELFTLSRQAANWRNLFLDSSLKNTHDHQTLPSQRRLDGSPVPLKRGSNPSTEKLPRISVITVIYNCGEELHRTAQTILQQSYSNLEWIVIDGASTSPETQKLLDCYKPRIDVFVSEPDDGIYHAMQKGADIATGEWAIYLGAGDYFAGDSAVERAVAVERRFADLIIGNVIEERRDGTLATTKVHPVKDKIRALRQDNYGGPWMLGMPPHQSTFMRTELIRTLRFDTRFRISADWDLIFRAANDPQISVCTIDDVVSFYPNGGFSAKSTAAWISEVTEIASRYCNSRTALEGYFGKLLLHHQRIDAERQAQAHIVGAYTELTGRGDTLD